MSALDRAGVMPEVYAYAREMDRQLREPHNQAKGPWIDIDAREHLLQIHYHAAKLQKAVEALEAYPDMDNPRSENEIKAALMEFAADVGNHAMMVADVCGALDSTEPTYDLEEPAPTSEKTVSWGGY